MGELDEKKLEINFLEKKFFAALAVVFALLGWLISNYQAADGVIVFLSFVALIASVFFVFGVNKKIRSLIKEVREL